ncbi:MAG: hypothetical protein WDZ58_03965 [Gemmatimonadaceae bacterium]
MASSICRIAVLLLQAAAPPDRVDGRVVRPGPEVMEPVAGVWTVLHRVGPDGAGPLDSARSDARGRYTYSYRRTGSADAVYFVSATHHGVTYFTVPLAFDDVSGDPAEIVVFDTTSRRVPITIRGRHIVVSAPTSSGVRPVTEVFELSNDTTVTLVSPGPSSPPTFSAPLPRNARDPKVEQGDVPADAVSFADGRVRVVAPLPPGVKQLAYSYTLPAAEFPLSIPAEAPIDVYEVLIEEPRGVASGAKLTEEPAVTAEGRTFRRFMAQEVPLNAVAVIDIPSARRTWSPTFLILFIVAAASLMLLALARAYRRK